MYIFTNFLCIDCPAKYKNFGQTQQQVTRSLCNLGEKGYRINYMHTVGLFYPRLIMLHVTVRSA